MTFGDYWRIVSSRWVLVAVCVVVAVVVAVGLSVGSTPMYAASSEVLIFPRGEDRLFAQSNQRLDERTVATEVRVVEGRSVRARVAEVLGIGDVDDVAGVSAQPVGSTNAIRLRVTSSNAQNAATVVNTYAQAYIDVRRSESVQQLLAASGEVQRAIDDLQVQIDGLSPSDTGLGALVSQQAGFRSTLDRLQVDTALRTGGATIIRLADPPMSPFDPQPARSAVLAGLIGLVVGVIASLVIEYTDDRIRSATELEGVSQLPILAKIPSDTEHGDHDGVLALVDPDHHSVESYRVLRTNIMFLALDRSIGLIQVTSSVQGEGKTTTAANLAVVLAQNGYRVAIVDADLRRPRIHHIFGVSISPGITNVLLGMPPVEVRQQIPVGEHTLDVYPAGDSIAAYELLSGVRTQRLLRQMADNYDFVILDSAPLLPVADSIALASIVDGIILVAQTGGVTAKEVLGSIDRLNNVDASTLGFVLNRDDTSNRKYYKYSYRPYQPDTSPTSPQTEQTAQTAQPAAN